MSYFSGQDSYHGSSSSDGGYNDYDDSSSSSSGEYGNSDDKKHRGPGLSLSSIMRADDVHESSFGDPSNQDAMDVIEDVRMKERDDDSQAMNGLETTTANLANRVTGFAGLTAHVTDAPKVAQDTTIEDWDDDVQALDGPETTTANIANRRVTGVAVRTTQVTNTPPKAAELFHHPPFSRAESTQAAGPSTRSRKRDACSSRADSLDIHVDKRRKTGPFTWVSVDAPPQVVDIVMT